MAKRLNLPDLERFLAAAAAAAALIAFGFYLADRGSEPPEPRSRVEGVAPGKELNLRKGPGTEYVVVATIDADQGGIVHLATFDVIDGRDWWQIRLPDGTIGWVNSVYLTPEN